MLYEKIKLKGIIEAILFTVGESVSTSQLAETVGKTSEEVRQILLEMRQDYQSQDRGIMLIELENSWQICTKIETYDYIRRLVNKPKKYTLSNAVLETLSIIAYKQPVTRQEIEEIRGVKCDFAINKLIEYKLVQELGRLDSIGHPIVFGTTEDFLRCFGVSSLEKLPDIDEGKKQSFFEEAAREVDGTERETVEV